MSQEMVDPKVVRTMTSYHWLGLITTFLLLPAAIALIITVIRTALEDRTLQDDVPGQRDYARRVRYRFVPGNLPGMGLCSGGGCRAQLPRRLLDT